jgi:hypothetical protein
MRPVAAVGIVVALAGVTGCNKSKKVADDLPPVASLTPEESGTPTPTEAAPEPKNYDPCALVSQQDAEQLAGTALDPASPSGNAENAVCTYTGPVTGPTAQVEVFIGDGAKKALDIDRETLGHAFVDIDGVGDEAYLEDFQIFFRKGKTWASIRLVRLEDAAGFAKPLENLARELASRM